MEVVVLIWWYLVTYELSNALAGETLADRLRRESGDHFSVGKVVGEYLTLTECDSQLNFFYMKNPYGLARCEGQNRRLTLGTLDDRRRRELEMRKLELEVENRTLEAEALRRILRDWPSEKIP